MTLSEGIHTITDAEYKLLNKFSDRTVDPQYLASFCKEISVSEWGFSALQEYPMDEILHKAIIMAFAALKSDNISNKLMYGFNITIRSSGDWRNNCYIDIGSFTVIHLIEDWYGDSKWKIMFLSPALFTDEFNYAEEAVLKVCR